MITPFGEYKPDLPAFGNDGALTAKNVVPHANGYKPLKTLVAFSDPLTAYCRGAFACKDEDGVSYSFAGDETKLYSLSDTTYNDVSRTTTAYASGVNSYWEFVQWGNKVLATNFSDSIQAITLGGTNFADLTGSPPKARYISAVRDFVVVGNTWDGTDGNVPHRVRWSGFNDETTWTVSATTQSDYQDLYGNGGAVQAIVGGQERGIIFQEHAIWLMTYVGTPLVFQFDRVEDRGAYAPRSVVSVGDRIFFLSEDGFYMFVGGSSVPIGANKVDLTFLSDFDASYRDRMVGSSDPARKIVMWIYPGTGNTSGTPNKAIIYDWANNKWSHAEFNAEYLYASISTGYTLEALDGISTSLDALTESLDSKSWMGGTLQFSAFNDSHRLANFSGDPMNATLETGEYQAIEGKTSEISYIRPMVDGGTHTVQVGTRNTQAGTVNWSAASPENGSGTCPVRTNARYHRARVNVSGVWNDAVGVEPEGVYTTGDR